MKIIFFLFLYLPFFSYGQTISTYAGNGRLGYSGDGGSSTNASLDKPLGVYIDKDGNLLICQSDLIRKVNTSTGIISTIAGDTAIAIIGDGGPATSALINGPYSICGDAVGNLYIADNHAFEVRKIDISTGIISDYAGTSLTGGYSGDGGPATAAKLDPVGVCIDTSRNILYFSDEYNYRIRKVDMLTGIISTYAGTGVNGYAGDGGQATNAEISRTLGICLDHSGNLYISDWDNERIRKIDIISNEITTFAGDGSAGFAGDGGLATNASLSEPGGLCFDSCGNFYFSDGPFGGNYRVRKIDGSTRIISSIAGNGTAGFSGDGGPATDAMLSRIFGVCFDKYGNLYVADIDNERIRKISPDSFSCYNSSFLGQSILNKTSTISLYPNPVHDELTITATEKITSVTVSNMMGKATPCPILKTGGDTQVDVSMLPPGIYFVAITDDEGNKVVRRFVKE